MARHRSRMSRGWSLAVTVIAAMSVLAACGSSSDEPDAAGPASTPASPSASADAPADPNGTDSSPPGASPQAGSTTAGEPGSAGATVSAPSPVSVVGTLSEAVAATGPTAAATVPAPPTPSPAPRPPAPAPPAPVAPAPVAPAPPTVTCLLVLHGKGGTGAQTTVNNNGLTVVSPSGNGEGWGGRQWLYFPDDRYSAMRSALTAAIDGAGCGRVIANGFSNGGAAAAELYCRGETFGGRLLGVVIDDPVPDASANGCRPGSGVQGVLYWTGGLAATAQPGWRCSDGDWTCDGGTTIGIDAFAANLGLAISPSIHRDHQPYTNPPELSDWA